MTAGPSFPAPIAGEDSILLTGSGPDSKHDRWQTCASGSLTTGRLFTLVFEQAAKEHLKPLDVLLQAPGPREGCKHCVQCVKGRMDG